MIDRAAILTDILRRDRLRRDNALPPLDVRKEFAFRVALAVERDFRDHIPELTQRFAAEREMIQAQVISDLRAQEGDAFPYTPAGHWSINNETRKRFEVFLRDQHGIDLPPVDPVNPIIYGAGQPAPVAPAVVPQRSADVVDFAQARARRKA